MKKMLDTIKQFFTEANEEVLTATIIFLFALSMILSAYVIAFVPTVIQQYKSENYQTTVEYDAADLLNAMRTVVHDEINSDFTARALKDANAVIITGVFNSDKVIKTNVEGFCGDVV